MTLNCEPHVKMILQTRKTNWLIIVRLILVCGSIGLLTYGCTSSRPSSREGTAATCPPQYRTPPKTGTYKPYKIDNQWYTPLMTATNFRQKGLASWYGKKFHGRKTANGEIYNMYAMTAAHKTLPMGTHVRVHNLQNGQNTVVRINDRGPFVRGRIIDLSYNAAKKIGIVGPGTAPVEIVALGSAVAKKTSSGSSHTYQPLDYNQGNFTFQVGAFKNRDNAVRLKNKLSRTYDHTHISTYDNGNEIFYRVRLGKCITLQQALEYENHLMQSGFEGAFAVAE